MKLLPSSILVFSFILLSSGVYAQNQQLFTSQQFRLGDRIIRIAEPGQIADSVNVWGDVGSSGRYIIPKGTSLTKLISYSLGPRTLRDGQTELDWSKMRVEINIHSFDQDSGTQKINTFKYRFEEPLPVGMESFVLENNYTVSVRVKRRPSFRDYLGIFASTITAVASTVVLLDRLSGN